MPGISNQYQEFRKTRRDLVRRALGLVVLTCITIISLDEPARGDEEVRAHVEQIVMDNNIQRDLSIVDTRSRTSSQTLGGIGDGDDTKGPEARGGDRSSNSGSGRNTGDAARERLTRPPIGDPGPVVTVLLWVLVGALAIVVAFHAIKSLSRGRRLGQGTASESMNMPSEKASGNIDAIGPRLLPDPLSAAEELARSGNYEDAVHLVLLLALEQLKGRFGDHGRSLTSLELTRKLPLETQSYRGLSALVSMVQLSRFGGRGLDEADYRRSVGNYRDIDGTPEHAQ